MSSGAYFNQSNIVPSALVGTGLGLATHSAGWGLLGAAATPLVMDTFSGRRREQTSLVGGSKLEAGRKRSMRRRSRSRKIRKGSKVVYRGLRGNVVKTTGSKRSKTYQVSVPSKRRTMIVHGKDQLKLA